VIDDGDRLLRAWTPRILRGALLASSALLTTGLCLIAVQDPDSYAARFHALQRGTRPPRPESASVLLHELVRGDGRAYLTAGLLVLTLVPIGRVVFTFVVFLRQRDWLFVALTGLVLAILSLGIVLGRIG
jgi:uncharacterized membrane protein